MQNIYIVTVDVLITFSLELLKANSEYQDKLRSGHSTEQTMFALSWDIEELNTLNSEGHCIHHELLRCIDCCVPGLFEQHNIPIKLTSIRKRLLDFIKRTAF